MRALILIFPLLIFATGLGAQTAQFYNGGTNITVDAGAIVYVDGDIVNDANGKVHNKGDIYLTKDWTNNDANGLDPTTGTVILDGSAQVIKGSQTTTFNNLDCRKGGTKTIQINTVVGGNTGVLILNNCPFDLNSKTLTVTNPLSSAITRTSGYIISETTPTTGYGILQWNIGTTLANYVFPFGTTSGSYIPFQYNVKTAGVQTTTGAVALSTYPTNVTASPNNRPLPTGVANLNDFTTGTEAGPICLDRYWNAVTFNYTTEPVADIVFTYRDSEWNTASGSTNTIVEDSLVAWKWTGGQWSSPTVNTLNKTANTLTVPGVTSVAFPWTLVGNEPLPPPPPAPCGDYYLPNAFSPNGDNHNDVFRPRNNCIKSMTMKIYNRWGNLVYESTDPAKGWNGLTMDGDKANPGAYAYEVIVTLTDNSIKENKGMVTLVK